MTKAVLFDLGDTMFRLGPFDNERLKQRFASHVSDHAAIPAEAAHAAISRMYERFSLAIRESYGEGRTAEIAVAAGALPHLDEFSDAAPTLAATFDRLFGETDTERWEPPTGRHDLLDALRSRGIKLAFVSNTMTLPELMDARLEAFGLRAYAEVAVYSVAVGERKPHPVIYESALKGLGIDPGEAVFVGDRVREDVRGPQSLGMRGVLTHEFRQEDPADAAPFAIIRSLEELREIV